MRAGSGVGARRAWVAAALALAAGAAGSARADGFLDTGYGRHTSLVGIAWEYGLPTWDLRSHLDAEGSPQGARAGVRLGLARQLSAGAELAWNRFEHTYRDGAVSRFQAFSGRATAHLYLTRAGVQPYVGLGAGGLWREARFARGRTETGLAGCVDPQVGVLVTLRPGVALDLAARYEWTTASFELAGTRAQHAQWAGLSAGLAFY